MIGAVAAAVAVLALGIPRLADMILAAVNAIGMVVALSTDSPRSPAAVRFRATAARERRDGVRAVVAARGERGHAARDSAAISAGPSHLRRSFESARTTAGSCFSADPDGRAGPGHAAWAKWGRRPPYFSTGRGTDGTRPACRWTGSSRVSTRKADAPPGRMQFICRRGPVGTRRAPRRNPLRPPIDRTVHPRPFGAPPHESHHHVPTHTRSARNGTAPPTSSSPAARCTPSTPGAPRGRRGHRGPDRRRRARARCAT